MGLQFSLGTYFEDKDSFNSGLEPIQSYLGGTDGRMASVTYTCNEMKDAKTAQHVLKSVQEPQGLVYHFEISSTAACQDRTVVLRRKQSPLELLKPMENQCLIFNSGWWQYKFCFLKDVSQAHYEIMATTNPDGTSGANPMLVAGYNLGRFEKVVDIEKSMTVHRGDTPEDTYVMQIYSAGTKCDVGDLTDRQTEVRFFCKSNEPSAAITGIVETGACKYVLTVATSLLCTHSDFKPLSEKVHEIICRPVLKSENPAM